MADVMVLKEAAKSMARCGNATLKHEALKELMLGEIAALPAGSRLPTVRQLMDRYQVSRVTVGRALEQLKESGFVEATVGRGIFVSDRSTEERSSTLRQVDLLLFTNDPDVMTKPSFIRELLGHLHRVLGQSNVSLRTTLLPYKATMSETVAKIEELAPQAVLLVNTTNTEMIDIVMRRKLPCVAFFPSVLHYTSNSLLNDNECLVRHQFTHLFGLGHRKIAYLHSVSNETFQRDHMERLLAIYQQHALAGIVPDSRLIRFAGYTAAEGYAAMKAVLAEGVEFTAVVCGDRRAQGVYEALKESGLVIGRDVSVVGEDDCEWAVNMQPPLTTVRIPQGRLAELALEKLQALLRTGGSFENIRIPSELIVRDSTGPVPQ